MTLIDNLKWRYATKLFDTEKIVDQKTIDFLKEAIRLAATSYGLQPFKVLIIEDPKTKALLRPVSYHQPQITDASHLFVFCSLTELSPEYIDEYIALSAATREVDEGNLKGYGDFMKNSFANLSAAEIQVWAAKQAYIAMANLLTACAEQKVDSCPIEGFVKAEYDALLDLKSKGLTAAVAVAVGYRSAEDKAQSQKKIRRSNDTLFI